MADQLPLDWQERRKVLDIERSFIVQAPAGSGKTELLVQRILSLLAVAEVPEEVLSITFTRKAAGEMRLRLLEALERAQNNTAPQEKHAVETWQRSRVVLARDREMGWRLLHNPARLQMMTIDGLCAFLTRRMPWLARFGEQPGVTEQPAELYIRAAETLLSRLDKKGTGSEAIETLLVHLDNRLALLRDLIVAMLGRRDQWLRHLMAKRDRQARQILECGLQSFVSACLQQAQDQIGADSYHTLWELALYAAGNLAESNSDHPLTALLGEEKDPGSLEQWQVLASLVLTASGEIRKSVNRTIGFPASKTDDAVAAKSRMQDLLELLKGNPAAEASIMAIPGLPKTGYSNDQWQILEALIQLLPLAVIELREVFRQQGQVDFIEIAGAAHAALGSVLSPEELLLQLDSRIRHILVDEFQDTSYAQYDLLRTLTAGWEPGDGRTLFAVGDPMQSIYRFREADVGLYLRVCQRGLDNLPIEHVALNTNFRSSKPLVEWVNNRFQGLFPETADEVSGAVKFSVSNAYDRSGAETPVSVHCYLGRQDVAEAEKVVELILKARESNPGGSIAVLVRSRNHLDAILPALKKAELRFQAQDVDTLTDRPVVQDVLSLVRALQHPADRVAWLAILRAPWCGLRLEDLLRLCGGKKSSTIWQLLTEPEPQAEMFDNVSPDGRARLARVIPVLKHAMLNRGRLRLRRLIESTWIALGGPACVDEADLVDAGQVFELLDEFEADLSIDRLEIRLSQLYAAPDPQAGFELQLMTIHKAKGLEFDTVILPGMGRGVRAEERTLLRWLEHPDYELLLAPIPPLVSEEQEPTYQAIGRTLKEKDDHETLRLLYVAVTRAKSHLHLLGHAKPNTKNDLAPVSRSLLSVIWPSSHEDFKASLTGAVLPDEQKSPVSLLRRLPVDWHKPGIADIPGVKVDHARTASGTGHYRDDKFRTRLVDEGRVVGTVVHRWLERIALDGLVKWDEDTVHNCLDLFMQQLNMNGVPSVRLNSCAATVESCLVNTLRSDRGRWLLDKHQEARCELSLNGVVNGQVVRATVDRTFIDQDGCMWVVDYKTSSPSGSDNERAFIEREKDRYRPQLIVYAELMSKLHQDRPVRSALYFPMIDGWIETV